MTERRPIVNIAGEDQELPAGDTVAGVGTIGLAAVSRSHTSDFVLTGTPANPAWNTERITLDAAYFSTATDDDIEVAKTLNYQIDVTASAEPTSGTNVEARIELHVDGVIVSGIITKTEAVATGEIHVISVSIILPLTAGERVGPRFGEDNGEITLLANSMQWTIVALEAAAAGGEGTGDFVGPASAVDGNLVGFDGVTGKLGKDLLIAAADVMKRDGSVVMTSNLQMGLNDVVDFIPTAGTGSSASLKDFFTGALSAGHGEGGGLSLQGAPANSVDVAAGTGLLRSIDDPTDQLRSIGWDLFNSGTLTASPETEVYFGVEWNSGSPQVIAKSTDTWNYQNEFPLGNAIRDSTGIHLTPNPHSIGDAPGETARRFFETLSISRDRKLGGLIIGETGTRNITLSAGAFWSRLNRIIVAALDTSVTGSVDIYHETAPSVFAVSAALTQWPNTQYGDGTQLVTMTNGRYAVLWWYLGFDGDVVGQVGRDEYTKIADAEDEPVPNTAPLRIANHAGLVARTVFQKDAATAVEIGSVFSNVFSSLGVQSHPDLTNINEDDHHPKVHDLAGAEHGTSTLAQFNTKLTSGQVDASTASRPPNGLAGGSLSGSYPNPGVDDGADGTAFHTDVSGDISSLTQKVTPTGADHVFINDAANSNAPRRALISSLPTGADADAIHDNVAGEIVAITEKTLLRGDDTFVFESEADSDAKRSGKLRNAFPPLGAFPVDTALGTSSTSSTVLTHPRAIRVRRIRAQFGGAMASGTYTFVLKSGVDIDNYSTVGTVTVTGTASKGASGVISVAIAALNTTTVELTGVGAHSGTDIEKICTVTMEAELD